MAGAGIVSDSEVIFESWLFKLRGEINSQLLHLSGAWNKKYFILFRKSNLPVLQYYNKKPKAIQEEPRGVLVLNEYYRVEKQTALKGKDFVCRLITSSRVLYLASDKEHIYMLLMFFLNAQTRLKENLESECFVVRPDNADDHRKIGSRGAMCLLHVSSWGISLALQLSKCILAQWPLRCIRTYECNGRGRFSLETGSHASTGRGTYIFNTRSGQDGVLYDRIDSVINEMAALHGLVSARVSNMCQSQYQIDTLLNDYQRLATLTYVHSDSSSNVQLKRISRDIYDHLAEHLGSMSSQHAGILNNSSSVADLQPSQTPAVSISGFSRGNGNRNVILSSQYLLTGSIDDGQLLAGSPSSTDATYSCEQRTGSLLEQRTSSSSEHEPRSSQVDNTTQENAAGSEFHSYLNVRRSPESVDNSASEYIAMSETAAANRILPVEERSYVNSSSASNSAELYSYVSTPDLSRIRGKPTVGLGSERRVPTVNIVQTSRVDGLQDSVPASHQNVSLKSNSASNDSSQPSDNQNVPLNSNNLSNDSSRPLTNQNAADGNSSLSMHGPVVDMALSAPGIKMSARSRVFTRNKSITNDSKV